MSDIAVVVIEYSPTQKRVMVRGVFDAERHFPKKLSDENQQNLVSVFVNQDMGAHVGFSGLEAKDPQ